MADIMGENIDLAAEKAVIGSLLGPEGYEIWVDISDIIVPNTFVADTHQVVYKCLNEIYKENPDLNKINYPLVLNKSKVLGYGDFLESKEEKAYLKEVAKNTSDKSNVKIFAKKLRKLEIARIIREQIAIADLKLKTVTGEESASDILGIAEKPILDLSQMIHGFDKDSAKLIYENINDYINERASNPIENIGISSGWMAYDAAIGGGFRRGGVGVIASRYKVGKSSCAINICYNVTSQNIPVLYLDTEMSPDEHKPRTLAMLSGVPINDIEKGTFAKNSEKLRKVKEAGEKVKNLPFYYEDISGAEFDSIVHIMKNWILTKVGLTSEGIANKCLIILDYLKVQSASEISKNIAEWARLGLMMTAYVNFCKKYQIAGLTFAQLNREGRGETDDSGTLAGSDRLGWFGQHISLLKIQSENEIQEQRQSGITSIYNRKLVTLEARHGPAMEMGNYLNIDFNKIICRMNAGPLQFDLINEARIAGQDGEVTD